MTAMLESPRIVDPQTADMLDDISTHYYNDGMMQKTLPKDVYDRFQEALKTGAPTEEKDQKVIAEALLKWARGLGATSFAHWFFPLRFGSGATGGMLGGLKYDAFIDKDWSSKSANKPMEEAFPAERLFVGETDGSSFPNGGLRVTHRAAAFTTWDRGSPPVVHDGTLMIPCCFITQLGTAIDDKTPLLRSSDAIQREGMRLLKNMKKDSGASMVHNYLGWEQEFFVVDAELYRLRPDLVNCGRTLVGNLPARNQQGSLNYFSPVPEIVDKLMRNVQDKMVQLGCAMIVRHNEVAPGQHEMSPIFTVSNASSDQNVLFMQIANDEAARLGLAVLFHEKPFAGINGSGKHSNWSVGTDTGTNFFAPGKTDDSLEIFCAGIACLAYGLKQHNELVRSCVASAGNDFRLGAQEAPPAIISLYPGAKFEEHVDAIINGGALTGFAAVPEVVDPRSRNTMDVRGGAEDRNRTAPFPHCGNRFEFRAVGSSQNCSMPIAVCNTMFSSGMSHLNGLLEGGMSLRDAIAQMFKENREIIFTGNGYSDEWPEEAKKRGLPNLKTAPEAARAFNSEKTKAVFKEMGIFEPEEVDARQELMYENYSICVSTEAQTLIQMVESGIIPACAKDLSIYKDAPKLAGDRPKVYEKITEENKKLKASLEKVPADPEKEAFYYCETVKPQMEALRSMVDKAEELMAAENYPFPTYEQLLYSHLTKGMLELVR
jgi:glutamine synthetase